MSYQCHPGRYIAGDMLCKEDGTVLDKRTGRTLRLDAPSDQIDIFERQFRTRCYKPAKKLIAEARRHRSNSMFPALMIIAPYYELIGKLHAVRNDKKEMKQSKEDWKDGFLKVHNELSKENWITDFDIYKTFRCGLSHSTMITKCILTRGHGAPFTLEDGILKIAPQPLLEALNRYIESYCKGLRQELKGVEGNHYEKFKARINFLWGVQD